MQTASTKSSENQSPTTTAESVKDGKTGEKSPNTNEVGYMVVNLSFVVPCYELPAGTDFGEIPDDCFEKEIVPQIETCQDLIFTQKYAQATAQAFLEKVKGSKVHYCGLVGYADEIELK